MTKPVDGYTLLLPPGWAQIPLRARTDDAIAAVVAQARGEDPDELRMRLEKAAAECRSNGGIDLYVPTDPVGGFVIPASFVVAEMSMDGSALPDPQLVVASLAAAEGARPVTVDGVPGVRAERSATTVLQPDVSAETRRIEYVMPVPEDPGRWLSATFSVATPDGADAETLDLLVDLFDAIMTTFRWA